MRSCRRGLAADGAQVSGLGHRHRPVNCRARPPPVLPPTSLGLKNTVIDAAAAANQGPSSRGSVPECDVYAHGGQMGARQRGAWRGFGGKRQNNLESSGPGGSWRSCWRRRWEKNENFACRVESLRVGSSRDNPDKCIRLQQFALKPIESWFSFFSLHSPPALKKKKKRQMDSRYISEKSSVGTRVGGGVGADFNCRAGRSVLRDARVLAAEKRGVMPVFTRGPVLYKFVMDVSSAEVKSGRTPAEGSAPAPGARIMFDAEKTGLGDHKDTGSTGILKRASPTHCPGINGLLQGGFKHLDISNPWKQAELANSFRAAQVQNAPPAERQPLPSSHIPVPRNRKPSGHADKEVMAATVLTSLSTSPLVLHPSSASTVPEPSSRAWKEVLSASYSSSTSGNWSWDTSDQSVPSTPSPPLSNDNTKNFLLSSQGDDVNEDNTESTHFMFEDPIPRKRKNSMKVMFKCLWKNCEKVLSTSSGIQRHIRTVHLERTCDSDYSDGEEDFYYSEIEVNMDSLTEGLSSLTPTSPTTAGPPPVFPPPLNDVPHSEHINMYGAQSHVPTLLSQSAPSTLCHIRTDHAYQATAPVNIPVGPELAGLDSGNGTRPGTGIGNGISVSWQSPPVIFKGTPGPVTHVRTVSIGEKRQPAANTHTTVIKNPALVTPPAKSIPGTRKPRGEAKKCRKVYGMEKRDMWCTACRWKKACQRFTD